MRGIEEVLEELLEDFLPASLLRTLRGPLESPQTNGDRETKATMDPAAPVTPTPLLVPQTAILAVMPRCPSNRLGELYQLDAALREFDVTTPKRIAALLGQVALESGEFRWFEEIWGPSEAQKRYEPPSVLATRLGNTQPGDGFRFRGRCPIQLTGRANYKAYGDALGVDLIANPDLAKDASVAYRIMARYWKIKGLNELADAGNFRECTRRINGGYTDEDKREMYWARAKAALHVV